MIFQERLARAHAAAEARLLAAIAALAPEGAAQPDLLRAMAYGVRGGKGLRAFLVLESAALFDLPPPLSAAAAVEALHAYSLIHDDLPAMDDDDLRRGQPTLHRAFDEALAILAGDALQALAFQLLTDPALGPEGRRLALVARLAAAAGGGGMVLGQAQDMAAEKAGRLLTLPEITALQAGKTGALFGFAASAGAVLAGADPAPLEAYARALGLAFQITDDLLDAEGDPAQAGKALRKDAEAGKATFLTHLGAEGARARAKALAKEAAAALAPYGKRAEALQAAAFFAVERQA